MGTNLFTVPIGPAKILLFVTIIRVRSYDSKVLDFTPENANSYRTGNLPLLSIWFFRENETGSLSKSCVFGKTFYQFLLIAFQIWYFWLFFREINQKTAVSITNSFWNWFKCSSSFHLAQKFSFGSNGRWHVNRKENSTNTLVIFSELRHPFWYKIYIEWRICCHLLLEFVKIKLKFKIILCSTMNVWKTSDDLSNVEFCWILMKIQKLL